MGNKSVKCDRKRKKAVNKLNWKNTFFQLYSTTGFFRGFLV